MGGQPSQESQRFVQNFQQQYQLIKDYNDPRFGEVQIFKNKSGNDLIMLKAYWSSSESDFKHCVAKCEKRTQVHNKNLIRLLGYHTNSSNNLCGDFTKVSIYFQYFENTLERQIEQRYAVLIVNLCGQRQELYAETELWNMLEQIVSVGLLLSQHNAYIGDIRPVNIMIDSDKVLKLAEYNLVQGDKTGFQRAYYNQEKSYLAPELLPFIQEQTPTNPPVTSKSEVFSLGLTMLECSTLISAKSLYSFSRAGLQLNYHMLNQMLEQVMQLGYSMTWYRMIREMVQQQPENRPSYEDMDVQDTNQLIYQGVLSPYRSQIQRFQPFSIAETGPPQHKSMDQYQQPKMMDQYHQQPKVSYGPQTNSMYMQSAPPPPVIPIQPYQSSLDLPAQYPPQWTTQPLQYIQPQQQSMIKSLPQPLIAQQYGYGMGPMPLHSSPSREELQTLPLTFQMQPIQEPLSDYRQYIAQSPQKPIPSQQPPPRQQQHLYYNPQPITSQDPFMNSGNPYKPYEQYQQPDTYERYAPVQMPKQSLHQQPQYEHQQPQYAPEQSYYQPTQPSAQKTNETPQAPDAGLSELDLRIQKALKSSQDTANRHYQTPSYY